jgi:hypothetical protein
VRVERIAWLFHNAARFADYPPAQVGQVVWCLASEEYGELNVLGNERIKAEPRALAAMAIAQLFEDLLARVCRRELSQRAKSDAPSRWANMACYMFWDICPIGPQSGRAYVDGPRSIMLDSACLKAVERTLAIPHLACQEAALHGLGHWHRHYPERVAEIVDAFLSRGHGVRTELVAYAMRARAGDVP